MFHDGQIVYDCTAKRPCVAYSSLSRRETHFIRPTGRGAKHAGSWEESYAIYCPESLDEAQALLDAMRIVPAPVNMDHCHKCFNWMTNHNKDGSCYKRPTAPLFEETANAS